MEHLQYSNDFADTEHATLANKIKGLEIISIFKY